MTEFDQIVSQYISAWNETDADKRRAVIDGVFAPESRYIDPLTSVAGRDAIDAMIAAAQTQFAGLTFALSGPVDAHHDQARFQWTIGPDGGEALAIGFDVVERNADGQLTQVLGFLDKLP